MKVNEKNILEAVEKALRACLQRAPFLEIESLEREVKVGDVCIDIVATVRIAKQRQRLALTVKNNGQPRVARAAAYQLARVQEESDLYGVFAAPYISPQTAEICVKEKIGYLDLAGNCRLTFGQLYIEQEGKPNPFAEKRDLRSLYSPKAARVLRVLLADPKKPWRVQALAEEAKVSLGQVSNVKSLLEDREWLKSSDTGLLLKDPESLLSEWSENFNSRKNIARNYYTLRSIAEMEADLAKTCEGEGTAYALTGFSGAARYAPSVRYQRVMAYVSRDVERIAKILSLKEVASGANVSLFTPYDEGVLYGTRQIDGICIASPVQIYLDLLGVKGRGEEAAKAILDEVIRRSW
ncbi:MAG: type IV toxin-antitoxin system AbiEi family antitoxin [Smithellaceae bacterium]